MAIDIYRTQIEKALVHFIDQMGEKNRLRDACEYALLNGGKRLRPILVLLIAEGIGCQHDVMPVALSVEFFHTASLIADDLPCMDNDDLRRNRPSLHKVFGEDVAILASYALIAEGYGGLYRNGQIYPQANLSVCLEAATRCAGIQGATNGQYLDLYPPDSSVSTLQKIIYQKTVTLFEIAWIFGWVFGGGNPNQLSSAKQAAYHLGMAFQIADDLLDFEQDELQQSAINIASVRGYVPTLQLFETHLEEFIQILHHLQLWTPPFQEMVSWLRVYPLAKTPM